ncbi:MAG: dihydrodipicolinate synthase family protein [Omnitrophica WOR_2 bacterium]
MERDIREKNTDRNSLSGVFAAAVTPLKADFTPDLDSLPGLLEFFTRRGCHGALLLGTTGEGPSFDPGERASIIQHAISIKRTHPDFRLLAGTGTPSLQETIRLTRSAFEAGVDGVVVLPPYYYKKISDEGLFTWFKEVIEEAVPEDKRLLGYHIPAVSGVGFSLDLLARLKDAFPQKFAGLKDSSGDPHFMEQLGEWFGSELTVFTGNDRLFSQALKSHASGCITAMSNLISPIARQVWDSYQNDALDIHAQNRLNTARDLMDRFATAPALLKALLARLFNFPTWEVRPPLLPLAPDLVDKAQEDLAKVLLSPDEV